MQHYKEIDECIGTSHEVITILDTISRGSMFSVLKARRGTKFVTLKVANMPDAMFTELLRREYELGCTLSHGCIVSILDFVEQTEAGAAIVMEYVEGATLDDFIASNPNRFARERVLRDILDGAEYLHHRGILHNDLKPQNIIVNRHGAARIIDFGLSASDDSLWNGCVGGSNNFSAPEIIEGGRAYGAASDVYSVGRVMEVLFEEGRYRRIVRRCLDIDPEQRYDSIAALRRAIATRRRRPFVLTAGMILATIALAIAIPYIRTAQESSRNATYSSLSSKVLDEYYSSSLRDVEDNRYTEFAAMAQGLYTLRFQKYRDSLPGECRLAAEKLFAEHIKQFDSLIFALPSIHTLPTAQRDSLMVKLEEIAKQIVN